ncbi:MAG TPA: hypothetical protein VF898_03270 [Chloroflexota bacterium]
MEDELVLLTSYFNLSGGRRQDNGDTFRVEPEVASATSPDGNASLYIVTESSSGGQMGTRARKRAADVVSWEYATHGEDPPPQRLKAALRASHETVREEFEGHVSLGLSVMAVEGDTVYLGQVAPAQVYVLHDGRLHSIPASVGGSSPFSRAIGSQAGPRISVFRDQIGPDDVVALCSSWFHKGLDAEDLRDCFGAGTSDDIAECLLNLAKEHDGQDVTAIVIEAQLASVLEAEEAREATPGFMEQVDTAVQALTAVGRMLWDEFRVERNGYSDGSKLREPSPMSVQMESESDERRSSSPVVDLDDLPPSSTRSTEGITTEHPIVEAESWDMGGIANGGVPSTASTEDPRGGRRPIQEQATDEVPVVSDDPTPRARAAHVEDTTEPRAEQQVSEMEQVNSRIRADQDMGDVIPPVQAFPEASTEPERIYATSKDIQAVNKRRPRRFGVPDGPPVVRPGLDGIDFSQRPRTRAAPPAVVWFGIAAVMVLIAATAAVYYLNHRHKALADPYPGYVRRDLALAAGAKSFAVQDQYLAKARNNLRLARLSGASARTVRTLTIQLQQTSDSLNRITRVYTPLLLNNFGQYPNAQPAEIATAPGMVYVLDAGRKSVFSLTANAASNPSTVAQSGEVDNGFTFGVPQHLATDGTTVLVLDDHNTLVRDNAGTKTATSLSQGAPQEKIVALSTNDPDVYTLDTLGNQVWRYPDGVSGYNPSPNAYFTPSTPHISDARGLAFDGTDLFILKANGTVLKFDMAANAQQFNANSGLRRPMNNPVSLYTDRNLPYVWVADPTNQRIVQFDKSGNYVRSYVSGTSTMPLGQIKSLSIGPAGKTIYVLAGSKIFAFQVVH